MSHLGIQAVLRRVCALLQEETNSFLKAIEEANKKMEAAELSLEEKDQRIGELDRLIERMEKVTDAAWAAAHLPGPLAPQFTRRPPCRLLPASLPVCREPHPVRWHRRELNKGLVFPAGNYCLFLWCWQLNLWPCVY